MNQENKLISPQVVKVCCGKRDGNTLKGPESKKGKDFYLTDNFYPDASKATVDGFV